MTTFVGKHRFVEAKAAFRAEAKAGFRGEAKAGSFTPLYQTTYKNPLVGLLDSILWRNQF